MKRLLLQVTLPKYHTWSLHFDTAAWNSHFIFLSVLETRQSSINEKKGSRGSNLGGMWQMAKLPVHKTLSVVCFCSAVTVWQDKVRHVMWVVFTVVKVSVTTRELCGLHTHTHTWCNCKSISSSTALGPLSLWCVFYSVQSYSAR